MNQAFQQFKQDKKDLKDMMKESRATLTLEWYEKIQQMLEGDQWERSHDFLKSVLEFIEEKEYITDKQIEITDRIFRHPENEDLPF